MDDLPLGRLLQAPVMTFGCDTGYGHFLLCDAKNFNLGIKSHTFQ
jgi:hypothetical protein